ncbi:MAG: SDR family oxidoreductase [Acidobacteria bacterium]|nr:SDR family oxidoreductase [Acidobacteriota bacterium]
MILRDQVAIITGGGRGIGRAIARKFASEGAAVVVSARTSVEVDAVVNEIKKAGGRGEAVSADVAKESDCERIVAAAGKQFGPASILVNNAGVFGPVKPAHEISVTEWDETLAINLRSAFMLSRLVLPEMLARGAGNILNIASIAAKAAYALEAPYAASKAGIIGLTRALAADYSSKGIRVNAICPGPVFETKMSKDLGGILADKMGMSAEQQVAEFSKGILQGRGQTADEIAEAALFLVSSRSSAITGQGLNVDGGMVFF